MVKANNAVAAQSDNSQLPAFMQGGKTAKVGNLDSSDLIIPRVKLLQKISPEIDAYPGVAIHRQFWHNIMNVSMGDQLLAVPLLIRKSYVLWAPRNDDRGILARATDAVHWDEGFENLEFEVQPKGSPTKVKYNTKGNVAASGLAEFGTSIPGDPNSPPAASLTYNILWYFPEHPELSPAVMINTRSSAKRGKDLATKIELRPVDHFGQLYIIGISDEKNEANEAYYNYTYAAAGYVQSEQEYNRYREMYEHFKATQWRANEEEDDVDAARDAASNNATSDKF